MIKKNYIYNNFISVELKKRSKYNYGFSLIEILVAATIASIILLMIATSYKSILTSIDEITGYAEFYENVNLAIFRIDRDISNTYFKRTNKNIAFIGQDDGETGRLDFVTVLHKDFSVSGNIKKPLNFSDIREVGYYIAMDPQNSDRPVLVRREDNHFDSDPLNGGEINIILKDVVGLTFRFKQGNDWIKNWDSRNTKRIPFAVKTTLIVKNYQNRDEEFTFITFIKMR